MASQLLFSTDDKSTLIPGPIVEEIVIFFIYLPLADEGLDLFKSEISEATLSASFFVSKSSLPIIV